MKAQILKIAGVKTDKEFYKLFPNTPEGEKAFMAKYGKEFKKAQIGARIGSYTGGTQAITNPIDINKIQDDIDLSITGKTKAMRAQEASKNSGGGGGGMGDMMGMIGGMFGGKAKQGSSIPKAQYGDNSWANSGNQYYDPNSAGMSGQSQPGVLTGGTMMSAQQTANQPITSGADVNLGGKGGGFDAMKAIPILGGVLGGLQALGAQKTAKQYAKQASKVAAISAIASGTLAEQSKRKYNTPWDNVQTGEASFPVLGVGTNAITKNGGRFKKAQNGFAEGFGVDSEEYSGDEYSRIPTVSTGKTGAPGFAEGFGMDSEDYDNEMYNQTPAQEAPAANFDSNSARDNWVQKTGLPWSEAKRLGYTSGSAKDNTKLLSELNDPRFKKENLRTAPSRSSSQSRTPVQHRETPSGRLAPIKPQSYAEAMKGKPKYSGNQGNIGTPDEGNMITRLGERLANPMQTFGEYIKYGELPSKGFSKYSKNAFDQALGLRNPAYWANAVGNASDYASEGEYRKAVIEAADALPALGKLKYVKNVPFAKGLPAGKEYIKRAGYLGEGAKRISGPASKQLGQAKPKALAEGFTPNFVMYKDGGNIGGNPTEIQNTYGNGNSIYDDLEYAPLDIQQAQFGFGLASKGGAGFGENPYGGLFPGGDSGGGQIGGAIGSAFGPVGGFVGQALGSVLDTDAEETAAFNKQTQGSMNTMFANKFGAANRATNSANVKNGGYMNPEYNPQVITMFGDHTSEDFADYANKDQYRAGGHLQSYTPPSNRAMETYANGGKVGTDQVGDVSIESGGYLEPISWNPHTGGTGFTSKFYGQSHVEQAPGLDHTGIIMRYGGDTGEQDGYSMAEGGDTEGNVIEAERGEYISERKDGGQAGESAQISGNRKYNSNFYDLGLAFNKEFEGMKIKNIQGEVANRDAKLNKFSDKNTQELIDFDPKTPTDKLKQNALIANQQGINMKYGINASIVNNALAFQNSANEVIDEMSNLYGKEINGDDFVKSGGSKINFTKEPLDSGKSKNGGKYPKAQTGYNIKGVKPGTIDYNPIGQTAGNDFWKDETTYENVWKPRVYSAFSNPQRAEQLISKLENYSGQDADDVKAAIAKGKTPEEKKTIAIKLATDKNIGPFHQVMKDVIDAPLSDTPAATTTSEQTTIALEATTTEQKKKFPWMALLNQFMPRPSDAEAFDYSQLYPEMFAMANNQLEPVPVQGYQPDLDIPYDISLQDQLNANQADFNSIQRMAGYNPAAQSALAAQKYAANSKVLGEQFRLNQAQKAGVYGNNRQILNQAKLTNLGIYDKQYERQAMAKSNTKDVAQAALNSMTDKVAKNKLENRTLQTYENLYNYRFDPNFKARNYNPLAEFDTTLKGGAGKGSSDAPEGYEYETILKKKKKKEDVARNGSIVKSYKNL